MSSVITQIQRRESTAVGVILGKRSAFSSLTASRLSFVARTPSSKMQNEEGQNMDLYIPRKCSATNRLITSKDHASVQINVGHLGSDGIYTNQFTTFALCGYIRAQAISFLDFSLEENGNDFCWVHKASSAERLCRLIMDKFGSRWNQGNVPSPSDPESLLYILYLSNQTVHRNKDWVIKLNELIVQGDADSALDRLWQKKKAEIRQ
ncbi:hypothetical protein SAY87_003514 [Trapa incisa]|uniref:Uncharacterized protein n=2 Tax=Magnoliopsida TaxID=3398 RepID=A0AAN7KFV9_9MYRT|nr:hypothetical protein SAY87_003514 [Trapa incisa]